MLKSAWRGVRSRGWSGVFVIALLGIALACNTVMFAFADSLVFFRNPYPDAERVVALTNQVSQPERLTVPAQIAMLDAWQKQPDIFSAVGVAQNKSLFLKGDDGLEQVSALDVTVGFLDVLGAKPRWGRPFAAGDINDPGASAVIITEDLARQRFGDPRRAPSQRLDASAGPMVVVGVMDGSFVYPNTKCKVWRAVDLNGPLMRDMFSLSMYAKAAPGVPMPLLNDRLAERAPIVGAAAGVTTYKVTSRGLFGKAPADRRTMVLVLVGAALSLLLAACANVASVELAGAIKRARTFAVRRALGASRWDLAGQSALEGAIIVAFALALGVGLAALLTGVLEPRLPNTLRLQSTNPVDLDLRALAVMAALAGIAWLVAALPAVVAASRSTLVNVLKTEDRSAAASRSSVWLRRILTASQVALAVALLIGGLLYARSYQNLLAVEKGFDSKNLFFVDWTMPRDFPSGELATKATEALTRMQGIEALTRSSPPPSTGNSPSRAAIEIDGGAPAASPVLIGEKGVDLGYFSVIKLPVKQGTLPVAGDSPDGVVVPEFFARRFFPEANAVGHSFRTSPKQPWKTIVAVVGDVRTERTRMPQADERQYYYYGVQTVALQPPPQPATPPAPRPVQIDTGGVTRFMTLTVRTNGQLSPATLLGYAKQIEPRLRVAVAPVDDTYAKQSEETRMASQIVGAFSVLAFIICMAGVFGVMAFLVAGRTREIGIRMALGAEPGNVRRMVLASSARMVMLGACLGLALAIGASRWVEAQLFGISATDPLTYALAAFGVIAVALFATWHPARQAARVDPAITLRAE